MDRASRKFVSRAPRYTLQPTDNRYMRYAAADNYGKSYTTQFVDISTTGLAFVADRENAPQISEVIKIEVPMENTHIAWWARVVRIEEYAPHKWYMNAQDFEREDQVMVAIRFEELPTGHKQQIYQNLDKKFAEIKKREYQLKIKNSAMFFVSQFWQLLIYGACIAATIWFIWYFSQPDASYDAKRGAPWGQRYPWLNFFTPENKKFTE
jgi:hypothetical protein